MSNTHCKRNLPLRAFLVNYGPQSVGFMCGRCAFTERGAYTYSNAVMEGAVQRGVRGEGVGGDLEHARG